MANGGNATHIPLRRADFLRDSIHSPATQGVVRPITIISLLVGFIFILYFCFYIIPFILRKTTKHVFSTGPLDIEDRIFTDEYDQRSSKFAFVKTPYDAFLYYSDQVAVSGAHGNWPNSLDKKPASLPYPGTKLARSPTIASSKALTHPPPAYTSPLLGFLSGPQSQRRLSIVNSHSSSTSSTDTASSHHHYVPKRPRSDFPKFKHKFRKGERPTISKPILLPEGPLPGPRMELEEEYIRATSSVPTFHFARASRRVQSGTIVHPPVFLPKPSQAHVYNRNSSFGRDSSSRLLSVGKTTPSRNRIEVPIESSKIGLAF